MIIDRSLLNVQEVTATCIATIFRLQRVSKSFQVIQSSNKMEKCSALKLFLIWLGPHLCLALKRRDTCSVCCSFPTIAVGQTGFANSPSTLSALFPPTSVRSLLPASLRHYLTPFIIYFFLLSLSLSQPLFPFLCHFPSASPCHYSAHMSRLKRQPLLPACAISLCGGARSDTNFVSVHVSIRSCLWVRVCSISAWSQSSFLLSERNCARKELSVSRRCAQSLWQLIDHRGCCFYCTWGQLWGIMAALSTVTN